MIIEKKNWRELFAITENKVAKESKIYCFNCKTNESKNVLVVQQEELTIKIFFSWYCFLRKNKIID